ncbi:hypothetical protein [Thomasclavelia cocleata]|uniref:NitT/TauT family transport system substrate-binding protein n=1 Tax=Thomasclavelia cocleata TaxID=69824 RepID=A0A1I0HH34_9FIRM|nr:hypothetical protein [Thomasclavelia cocleata]MCR1960921.1 hypothetical protein [Thomasclavelia cocleata]NDO43408.1 hypothetical protein [Thomasclavelia cocleata]PJN79640.1 hypothetical protein CWE04_12770 [Thomasclavelia cocleata]SET83198.1 NitT/TauT family transport system substrate-binding protein [Thomasclavelia cocleata]
MKRFIKYLFCLLMLLMLVGCNSNTSSTNINILCPVGAPALSFVSEYENINKTGKIDFVDGSDQLIAELSKNNSDYDIIVAPINLGAKLIQNKQSDYKIKGIITWGNLYYVGTSDNDLKETGELALFGEGAVPQKIVDTVKINTSLTPKYYQSATLVQQQLLSGNVKVGMLAEPLASATIAKAKQNNLELSIIADLQKSYDQNGYPQAAIFIKDGKDYKDLFESIDDFTNNGYEGLKEYLEKIGINKLSLPSIEITTKSIDRQNIHYQDASKCSKQIKDFLKLFNIDFDKSMLAS